MSSIFHFPLHHIPQEMLFCLHSAQNILISYPVPETSLQYLSIAPHLQCVYFLSHLLVPCPTLTPIASYREHIAVQNLQLCAQANIPSHSSLFWAHSCSESSALCPSEYSLSFFFVLPKSSSSHSHSCSYILLTPYIF